MLPTRRSFLSLAAGALPPGRRARWRGTFLQLWAAHKEWPEQRWSELFGYLRALGMREIVVQWSRYEDTDFRPEVERALRAGFDVWMGLGYGGGWWSAPTPELVREAARGVARLPGVRGYYLPHEIEHGSWAGEGRLLDLADAVKMVRSRFRPLAVSGFTNRGGSPEELARFWERLRGRSRFDRLLFQDGIGSGQMTLEDWTYWASPLARAFGRRLTIVVETFTAQGEGPAWRGVPAEMSRIDEQLRLAARLSRNPVVAFSAPDYMTPLGGAAAAGLYRRILAQTP